MAFSAPQPVSSSAKPDDPAGNLSDAVTKQLDIKEEKPADEQALKQKAPKAPKEKKPKANAAPPSSAPLEFTPTPEFFSHRMHMFDKIKAEQDAFAAAQPRDEITITMPDGSERKGKAWETSPMDVAKEISKSLAERTIISKINGDTLWDLERPLEKSCKLEFFDFATDEGKRVFWHSSAHVLGEAAEKHYGCHLCIGPPTTEGFFYEMGMGESGNRTVRTEDFPALESLVNGAVKEKQRFERLVVTKEQLLEMFKYNKYKKHIISDKIPDGTSTTVYRCGPMVDLCVGPHIPHTGRIKAMSILKNSASYFLGDQANDSLQRIYGISFPDSKQMKEYKIFLEEAAKRDHRKIGVQQELFFFNDMSPGSCFWLPHGTRIYSALQTYIQSEYRKRGFVEVGSPNMFNRKLWETSGHWNYYADDMFKLTVDKTETFALKPMNCPGHCLIFGSRDRSYRELPLRMAEFGVIHRNEASGALSGLTRVRRFVQDDAHIFCTSAQVEEEMINCFNFLDSVYGKFGFKFSLGLSTRPDKFIGDPKVWDEAEGKLRTALERFVPGQWVVNEGDGAFYGPKVDIDIKDAMNRSFQCATIQLDFNLPNRFDLKFRSGQSGSGTLEGDFDRPVMIHRAILGSLERFIAILTENFAGKWPFWLSPRQVVVIPVAKDVYGYAEKVRQTLWDAGLYADVDTSPETLPKKVRNGEIAQYNFILVVGAEEMKSESVNIRNRDNVGSKEKGRDEVKPLADTLKAMLALKETKSLENTLNL